MSLDELTALENKVKADCEGLEKSVRVTAIVYIVLAGIVLFTTSQVVSGLKEATSAEAIAEIASGMVRTHAPLQRERLLEAVEQNKDEWADAAMQQMHASLPALEAQVEVLLDQLAGTLVEEIEGRLVPAFTEYVKKDAATLAEQYEATTNDEIAAAYVEIFVGVIDRELDTYLDEKFISTCEKLQKDLHFLSKADAKLTKKQDAQRRLIQAWAHLSDHQEFGDAIFTNLLVTMKNKFAAMTSDADFTEEELDQVDELVEEEKEEKVEGLDKPLRLIPVEE
jgi:DNA gyrase/topoisomerase IV subunit B